MNGYRLTNMTIGGEGVMLGKHHSYKTRQKISRSNKGKKRKPHSEETKLKLSKAKMGNKHSLGHKVSEEHRHKISEANKGKISWMKGKSHSEETKHKMSEARKVYWTRKKQNNG